MIKTSISTPIIDPFVALFGIKLDDTNYTPWSQIVEMYISSKDKLGYVNGKFPQPYLSFTPPIKTS